MITVVSATNRLNSNTLALSKIVCQKFQELGAEHQLLDLNELPEDLFLPKHYHNPPESFAPFQSKILNCKGLFIVVPEYNGSFPGAFKYFIDMLKFPESLRGLPVSFVGVSAGQFGALRSIEQLEMIFQYREAYIFNKRVLFAKINDLLSPDKKTIISEYHLAKLTQSMQSYVSFVESLGQK